MTNINLCAVCTQAIVNGMWTHTLLDCLQWHITTTLFFFSFSPNKVLLLNQCSTYSVTEYNLFQKFKDTAHTLPTFTGKRENPNSKTCFCRLSINNEPKHHTSQKMVWEECGNKVETYSNSLKISRKGYSPTWKLNTSMYKELPGMPRCAMQFISHTWLPAHGAYSTLNSSIWSNPLHQQPKPIISCPCTKLIKKVITLVKRKI